MGPLTSTEAVWAGRAGQLDVLEAGDELLEERPDLEAGQVGAEAVVAAEAEAEVLVGVGAGHVEGERVGEDPLVAVGRLVGEQQPVALGLISWPPARV